MSEIQFNSKTPNPDNPQVFDITTQDVEAHLSSVQVIDVRQPDEYTGELSHIEGSTLIPLDQLEGRVNELSKESPIVFICRSGRRSVTASVIAMQNGFNEVYNMAGGMIQWNEAGQKVASN